MFPLLCMGIWNKSHRHSIQCIIIQSYRLLESTVQKLADSYLYSGSPINAACCHMAVDDHQVWSEDMSHGYWWSSGMKWWYVTWLLMVCHMTVNDRTHGCWWYVTWLLVICHMTADDMSHDCWWYVTWLLMTCHMTVDDISYDCWWS